MDAVVIVFGVLGGVVGYFLVRALLRARDEKMEEYNRWARETEW